MTYVYVWRCAECGWSTESYDEGDAHKNLPDHFVTGRCEFEPPRDGED
jgi:rubredoxin